ncbi:MULTISPECIES: hypothetical protein [Acinetobacter calcoaceticus/baumannii complex]|uniref:Uncharacterized protein n=2 Tax=Acinetobacter baumannii TaxID=470 RepID=A0A009PXX6_ACIBA|nr:MULTISPECIES: hypothetical protein [Acinetobacter calcoaceticus/baumannii complex]EXB51290.1 hypothetical protein J540_1515 [Acinetobacter baumannii 1440422]EXG31077.1 hypothetical protein J717_3503 [Acinetobacter baumannii 121738]SSW78874.1 Uncharacterised protein [Klebsiella pneumoniae]ATI38967.1 transposase [Acinetobacter baumannii]EHU3336364.1 hypothetical protein [Acinetobacter baumannii]
MTKLNDLIAKRTIDSQERIKKISEAAISKILKAEQFHQRKSKLKNFLNDD